MAKLGYTFYPKDWGNSENVFELNLCERGLYRELIDLAMLNDNKIEIKIEIWSRKYGADIDTLKSILEKLEKLDLIKINKNNLFIPSCERRLNLSRGGKKSKPTLEVKSNLKNNNFKPISKPISKPTSEPISEQREREIEREIEIEIENKEIEKKEIEKKEKVFNFRKSLIELGFKENLVEDWLKVRKQKKAVNTQTALNKIKNEVEATDLNIDEILKMHIERSWSGFNVMYYESEINRLNVPKNKPKTYNRQTDEVVRRNLDLDTWKPDYLKT